MALHRVGRVAIQKGIDTLQNFTQANVKGRHYVSWRMAPKGRLDAFELSEFHGRHKRAGIDDEAFSGPPVFVIYSYQTPIAWTFDVHEEPRQRRWVQNTTNYSVTTSHHQGAVAVAINNPGMWT